MTSATQVKRIRMSEDVEQKLKQLAEENKCEYHGKPSISKLLSKIANGYLEIKKKSPVESELQCVPLVQLEITVLSNLNGTIAEIANKLANFGVNIFQAKSKEHSNAIQLIVHIPEEIKNQKTHKRHSLIELFNSLQEINVERIINYNEYNKLEKLLSALSTKARENYIFYKERIKAETKTVKQKNKKSNEDSSEEELLKEYLLEFYSSQSIVTNINCMIGYQVVINNQAGTLAELTSKIAEKFFSIIWLEIDVSPDKRTNIINLILGFYPLGNHEKVFEKLSSIKILMEKEIFQDLNNVIEARQLSALKIIE
ncbi:hypothetical protein NSTC745_05855 [Nostoc sp. DSM 114161]